MNKQPYIIVRGESIDDLEFLVCDMMEKEYIPCGAITYAESIALYLQPMMLI